MSEPRFEARGQGVLVAGLRGGKQEEGLDALVANEGLRKLGSSLDDIDEVIDYPAFGPHDQVEVAQAHVEIDHGDCLAGLRERGTQGGGRRRLADAALPGCHRHGPPPPVTLLFQSSATTLIVSPSGQAWIGQPRRSASMSSAVLYRPS